jgi:hypothetical protein
MESHYKDFIGTYTNVAEDGYCEFLIKEFERLKYNNIGRDRVQADGAQGHEKKDYSISIDLHNELFSLYKGESAIRPMYDILQNCFDEYTREYSILTSFNITGREVKMQKSNPGEGYHIWHCEQGNGMQSARALVWILYLNTLEPENAGETEFLYQQTRIRPIKNTMVFFPASFTHVHRGNPVHGQISKYIVTGWFHYKS